MKPAIVDFLCQALQTEQGGVEVYTAALSCAQNEQLKEELQKYLEETEEHVQIYTDLLTELGIDPDEETPGRPIVRQNGESLVALIEAARDAGDPDGAEIVAVECVVNAENRCHLNWELVGELGKKLTGEAAKQLTSAYEEVEDQEDEHLYHSSGWLRELWIQKLGMPAVLPPPEEEKDVKTAIGAARAKHARKEML